MNQRFATTLQGQTLGQHLQLSQLQQQYLNYLDCDEVDCQIQIQFTTPKNVIDTKSTIYLTDDTNQVIHTVPLTLQGDYYQQQAYAVNICQVLSTATGLVFTPDVNIQFTDMCVIQLSDDTNVKGMYVNDWKLANILGITTLGKVYEFNQQCPQQYGTNLTGSKCVYFDVKMYISIYRWLYIYCSQLSVPGLTTSRQNMYIIAKQTYMFPPGTMVQVSQNFPVSFMTNSLCGGIEIDMRDEHGQQIDLEGMEYQVDIQAGVSSNKQVRKELESQVKQMWQQQQQQKAEIQQLKQQQQPQQPQQQQPQQQQQQIDNVVQRGDGYIDYIPPAQVIPNDEQITQILSRPIEELNEQELDIRRMFWNRGEAGLTQEVTDQLKTLDMLERK